MKKLLSIYLIFGFYLAQATDISFENNTWTLDAGITESVGEVTIEGEATKYKKVSLVKSVDPTTKNLYFVAEVFMTNIQGGPESYKWPKFKIYNASTSANILAYNMDENIEGKWVTTGMVVENFHKKGVSSVKVEFGFQNGTGTMKIRNPRLLDTPPTVTYTFPFDVPADPSCNIAINTNETHVFENDLLSANSHFSWASYKWSDQEVVSTINNIFPMSTMRFPGGTVGNFYNYATDGYYGDEHTFINASREAAFNSNFTFDYSGYQSLCKANGASSVLMFNVVQDNMETAKSRLQSRINDGLNVKWIEMGNENFFVEQGLGNVSSMSKYISHTTSLASGLKMIDPNVKVAVNVEHDNYKEGSWNSEMSKLNYYDAAVMHPYVSTNTFMLNDVAANVMFSAFKTTTNRIHEFKNHNPGVPLLFTEWSILSSGTPVNFVQTLSLADMFLAIEKGNQDGVVKQAGIHMLYHSDAYKEATLTYYDGSDMVLTANGVMYAELFKAFKGKTVYDAVSSSADLSSGLPAVNGKAILDGDSIRVFVVNKLPVTSPMNITVDGVNVSAEYSLTYFTEDPAEQLQTPYTNSQSPWKFNSGVGVCSVPAYSIAVVSYKNPIMVTSVSNASKQTFKVYPNPASSTVTIENHEGETWRITDNVGQLVKQGNSQQLNTSSWSLGLYFLSIKEQNIPFLIQ